MVSCPHKPHSPFFCHRFHFYPSPSRHFSGEDLVQHFNRLKLWKIGQMQAVVSIQHLNDAATLNCGELKKMGCRIVHTEEPWKRLRFHIFNIIGMGGKKWLKSSREKIEKTSRFFKIRENAQKASEMHEKHQMEIGNGHGKTSLIEPLQRVLYLFIE